MPKALSAVSKFFLYSVLFPATRQPEVCFPAAWGAGRPLGLTLIHTDCSYPLHSHPRAEGSESAQLAEIYAKLEEIEADKAPARYLKFPLPFFTFHLSLLLRVPTWFFNFFTSRASVILAGLGFTPKMQQQPTR